ncbi:hypothetical protein ACIA5D_12355 [Actinoplanes sp. NPDC051513]|uniref:hypothetical protein n=1 Tax=Actinoplanes sp. NPDC051513 TaxID=3363908 RepID=UPI00379B8AF2
MDFFTKSQLAEMRDPTRSRRYSPAREEFRREHARQRAWGLVERHARKLRRLHGGDDGSPLTAAERRLWSSHPGTPAQPAPPMASSAHASHDLGSPQQRVVARPAGKQIPQPTPALPVKPTAAEPIAAPEPAELAEPTEQAEPAAVELIAGPVPTKQAEPAAVELIAGPVPTEQAEPAAEDQSPRPSRPTPSAEEQVGRAGSLRKNRHRGPASCACRPRDRTPRDPRHLPYITAAGAILSTASRAILSRRKTIPAVTARLVPTDTQIAALWVQSRSVTPAAGIGLAKW